MMSLHGLATRLRFTLLSPTFFAAACGREPTGGGGAGGVRERWYVAQRGDSRSRPAVVGDAVYFGTGDGQVVARDRRTGAPRWATSINPGGAVEGRNLLARSGVVVALTLRQIVAVDAATGRERWRAVAPVDSGNGLAGQLDAKRIDADDRTVFVPAWGASVSALDLQSGAARWVWRPGKSAGDTAAGGQPFRSGAEGVRVSGDTVFVAAWHFLNQNGTSGEPWLVALDKGTGHELWRVVLPIPASGVPLQGAPAFYGDLVIVATQGGHVWAVNRQTQQVAWHRPPEPGTLATFSPVEVHGDVVYIDGRDEKLYALRAADGTVLWAAVAENVAKRDLLITEQRVYYPTGGSLHVFDRMTGRLLTTLRVRVDGHIFESAATFSDGQVFVLTTPAAWSFDEP